MAEPVFKAPGFFDKEIDLSGRKVTPTGTPAGIIGASSKGPAFVPITIGTFDDFESKFGSLNVKLASPYAVKQFLVNRFSATFVRVLGAGANKVASDFTTTKTQGTVKNAGWRHVPTLASGGGRHVGSVQFIVANHTLNSNEAFALPMFSNNTSFTPGGGSNVYLVRGMLLTANDTKAMVLNGSGEGWVQGADDVCNVDAVAGSATQGKFKIVLSSSVSTFGGADGFTGLKIFTASLNPTNVDYIGKILNTDPEKFETAKHLLYGIYSVDDELASVVSGTAAATSSSVALLSGSDSTSATSGDTTQSFLNGFGRFDTRYKTPSTTNFISQPFGATEYDLFRIESQDDGAYANNKIKISIANIKVSPDPKYLYGTFNLLVRDFNDTDFEQKVLESFNNLTLDPDSDNYIAKIIGDISVKFNFDVESLDDRRLTKRGKYPNVSKYIRVVMNDSVERKVTPAKALPFGFRGLQFTKTNDLLTDGSPVTARLNGSGSFSPRLLGAIVPPVPYRFKATRGNISGSTAFEGYPGPTEIVDSRLYWGVKLERNTNVVNSNVSNEQNTLFQSLVKFQGIKELDMLTTGSGTDTFCNNKFTLARVALYNGAITDVTSSADTHMLQTAYIRNGSPDVSNYTVNDGTITRITLATILNMSTDMTFNKFSDYAKFTTVLQGGFDGLNILDKNASRMQDKGTSTETLGGANGSYVSPGFTTNQAGAGLDNNNINSFNTAINIITDPMVSNVNLVAVPGIRDSFVTDYAATKTRDYQMAMYLMDVPYYDSSAVRIFDGDTDRYTDVQQTATQFESRAIDNNAVASYFPNIVMQDDTNGRKVTVPASVGALAAIGFNDRISYPWYAPAGFNRGSLDFVTLTQARINQADRERLYDVRLNPIIKFPGEGYVIFSQKTLQLAKSSLDSINVKRMILEVKRIVVDAGNRIMFEQITPSTYQAFANNVTPLLANVQIKQGIEMFRVLCDRSNNTDADIDANRVNGQIKVVPTRAVEAIFIDFIVTSSGVQFI